jgi:hypothetical protein
LPIRLWGFSDMMRDPVLGRSNVSL